jgi:hypothetical protein
MAKIADQPALFKAWAKCLASDLNAMVLHPILAMEFHQLRLGIPICPIFINHGIRLPCQQHGRIAGELSPCTLKEGLM